MTGLGRIALDVAAKANDEVVDGARVGVFVEIPDILQDRFARDGFAGIADEIAEKFGFHQSELEGLFADFELQGLKVEDFAFKSEFIGCRCGGRRGDSVLVARVAGGAGSDDD